MSDRRMSRRRVVAAMGATGTLAGCLDTSDEGTEATSTGSNDETSSDEGADGTNTESNDEATSERDSDTIYVSPDGDDSHQGTDAEPMGTIMAVLDTVEPGETVYLQPGVYTDRLATIIPGEPENPITITGSKDAVLKPSKEVGEKHYYPLRIQHSHYRLTGITISGLQDPAAPEQVSSYATQLLQISPRPESSEYIENVTLAPHGIGNSQRALISVIRTKDSEFGPFKVIGPAGVDYLYGDRESHVGEILYIGQPLQTYADGAQGYFWERYDQTRNLHIHHIDNSDGYHHSEIVDCKDGTRNITIEYCTDGGGAQNNDGIASKSILMRGHNCTVRWNHLAEGTGNGIQAYKPGSDALYPEFGFDEAVVERIATENEFYGNEIYDFEKWAIALDEETRDAQRHICGNDIRGDTNGDPEKKCPDELPDGDGIGHTGGDSPYSS